MCKKCRTGLFGAKCGCECNGKSMQITQEHLSAEVGGGSRTIGVCTDCKHKVKI